MFPTSNVECFSDDDKYSKYSKKSGLASPLQKYSAALGISQNLVDKASGNFFYGVACLMLVGIAVHFGVTIQHILNAASLVMEMLGLLWLRHKINVRGSVNGISGNTMIMYAVVYVVRIYLALPSDWSWEHFSMDATYTIISLLLVLDILRSVFVTHRKSYQAELDVLQAKYVIPGCIVAALLVRPHFHFWSTPYSLTFGSCLYMDVLALMPQVVMMQRAEGKIEAPIAHFVAATFLSRLEDVVDSLMYHHASMSQGSDWYSFWMLIFVQCVHLLLVADFMYIYLKARSSGKVEDLQLTIDV